MVLIFYFLIDKKIFHLQFQNRFYLKYGLKTIANFVFGIKQGDDYFLVKINKDLTDFSKPVTNVSSPVVFI